MLLLVASLSQVLAQQYILSTAAFAGKCVLMGGAGYVTVAMIANFKDNKK